EKLKTEHPKNIKGMHQDVDEQIEFLDLIAPALMACVSNSNLEAIDKVALLLQKNHKAVVEEFLFCNPLGIAMTFGADATIKRLAKHFGGILDPNAPTLLGDSAKGCLKYCDKTEVFATTQMLECQFKG